VRKRKGPPKRALEGRGVPPAAAAAATARGFLEVAGNLVLERDALHFQLIERCVVQRVDAVFDAADALVQFLVVVCLAGERRVLLAQPLELLALFGEVLDQGMMVNVHGSAPDERGG